MTILVSSHILEELYQTASEFILIDHGKIIEEISDYELNERCKRHIAIKTTDVQKTVLVLEENLHTDNFKLMPDGIYSALMSFRFRSSSAIFFRRVVFPAPLAPIIQIFSEPFIFK